MMDQDFFENSVTKMKHRYEEGDIKKAVYIADKIDWEEVRDVNLLIYVSIIYEEYKDYDSAKALLEHAFEVAPIKSRLYYALCNIHIKLGNLKKAQEFYYDFCENFPHDNRKILLKYYFLKKKGAKAYQKVRVLEEFVEEEKTEETLFELAVLYEEMKKIDKAVETCEYLVNFFGVKKNGYGRKALALKKRYTPLTQEEENLLINYEKENDEEGKTNIVYQTISRPNLKVVQEKDEEEMKIEKLQREEITEEKLFKDKDETEVPVIKYEPETIKELRDKELEPVFMKKEKEEQEAKRREIEEREKKENKNTFDKYRAKSLDREDEDMKLEEIKQNMIIEAASKEEAYNIGVDELKFLHKAKNDTKKAAKVNAVNINERGFSYYIEKLGDRDLIIENAGKLINVSIDEVEEFILKNRRKNIIVLCDVINAFDKIAKFRPSFINRFDIYSTLSEKKKDGAKNGDNKNGDGGYLAKNDDKIDIDEKEKDFEEEKKVEDRQPVVEQKKVNVTKIEKTEIEKNAKESKEGMSVDEFVEFCKSYAKSIDCNMPGKTIPALYERIEMLVDEGIMLTRERAEDMIERAADKAEKRKLFSKPKYDKDGNLIIQEEHILG